MGGRIALNIALEAPERCLSLTLESASPGIDDEVERTARRAQDEEWARQLETGKFEEFLERWYGQPLFASLRQSPAWDALLVRRRRNDPAHLARVLRGMGAATQRSFWPVLPALNLPILFVAGILDEKYTAIGGRVAGLCKNARRIIVHGAGHTVHVEDPGALVEALRGFLSKHS
jgi:2-succinyl-6-hydroxy-2,4-cyclohexadiene-1-carboxylate synthase